ncbi:hypothetical protein PBOI14_66130 [Pseudomonas sp. Boi14]|nr:hypothetical protein PBOI14_66130 [Pseudomonas sp. Boi14]
MLVRFLRDEGVKYIYGYPVVLSFMFTMPCSKNRK